MFFNPSVLRTPPLYFAAQNTEEEGEMYFPFASASILYTTPRNAAGHGRGSLTLNFVAADVFNPSVLRTPPLYFAAQNTGED